MNFRPCCLQAGHWPASTRSGLPSCIWTFSPAQTRSPRPSTCVQMLPVVRARPRKSSCMDTGCAGRLCPSLCADDLLASKRGLVAASTFLCIGLPGVHLLPEASVPPYEKAGVSWPAPHHHPMHRRDPGALTAVQVHVAVLFAALCQCVLLCLFWETGLEAGIWLHSLTQHLVQCCVELERHLINTFGF